MPRTLLCPHCNTSVAVPDVPGQTFACPRCRGTFVSPALPAATRVSAQDEASRETIAGPLLPPPQQPSSTRSKTRGAAEPSIGKIGRFEIRSALGQGAFGRVYRAFDPMLDRQIALKVPRFPPDRPQQVERFLREAKAAARLRHPNIVAVFESGRAGDELYIAAEFVEGVPLSVRISERATDLRKAAQWVRELADGLAYAAAEGIVHRDIKPANIMLGNSGRPQLMDFGLAKRVDEDATVTTDGSLLGTPAYMSPEQARGDVKNVGPLSDQYSLGVVLYELLTGKKPFEGPPHVVIKKVIDEEPAAPHTLRPDVPRDLEAICLKAMDKLPARRYAGALEFAADLDRWLRDETVVARPVGVMERAWRWCHREPALALAMGITATALCLAAILGGSLAFYEIRTARALREEQSKTLAALADANQQRQLADQARIMAEKQKAIADDQTRKTATALSEAQQQRDEAGRQQRAAEDARRIAEEERQKAFDALTESTQQRRIAEMQTQKAASERQRASRAAAGLALNRGVELCEKDDIKRGLLVLAQALEITPADAADLQRVVRTNLATWSVNQKAKHTLTWPANPKLGQSRVSGQSPVAFSPDGRYIATGTDERFAFIWDAATGEPIGQPLLLTSKSGLRAIAFSGDSRVVGTGSTDKTARFWDVVSGRPLSKDMAHEGAVSTVTFCLQLPLAATGGHGMYVLRDLEAKKNIGTVRQREEPFGVGCAAFSPDGETFVWAERSVLCVGDGRGKRNGNVPPLEHLAEILAVTFSPDGKHVLTGSKDRTARIWNLATGEFQSLQHLDEVTSVAFAPDGRTILTGSADKTARLWDVATGAPLARPLRHTTAVRGLSISPDGQTLITGTLQASAQTWAMPQPVTGEIKRITLWVQVKTGLELEGGENVRVLDEKTRDERAEQLLELGGPPIP